MQSKTLEGLTTRARMRAGIFMGMAALFLFAAARDTRADNVAVARGYAEYYVMGDEADLIASLKTIPGGGVSGTATAADIQSRLSIVSSGDETDVYLDEHEDGYEFDPANPAVTADMHWTLAKGQVLVLTQSDTFVGGSEGVDGGDKIVVSGAPVTVVRTMWPLGPQTFISGSWPLYPTLFWESEYRCPVGEDVVFGGNPFVVADLYVTALDNNTSVVVTNLANTVIGQQLLSQGQNASFPSVNLGTRVRGFDATTGLPKPLQGGMVTSSGDSNSRYYTLFPTAFLGSEYLLPVPSLTYPPGEVNGDPIPTAVYAYAKDDGTTIAFETNTGVTTQVLNSNQVARFVMPFTPNGFVQGFAGARVRSLDPARKLNVFVTGDDQSDNVDWGYNGVPTSTLRDLSNEYYVPLAPVNPLYVTPAEDGTTIRVDFNNDGTPDQTYHLNRFEVRLILDPDQDATGAHVYGTGPFLLVWGQDNTESSPGEPNPDFDQGYSVLPLGLAEKAFRVKKTAFPGALPSTGGTATFSLQVDSLSTATQFGSGTIFNIDVTDTLPPGWAYVAGSTVITFTDGNPTLFTNPTGTPGPVLTWALDYDLAAGESFTITFDATATSGFALGENVNRTTASGTSIADETSSNAYTLVPESEASVFISSSSLTTLEVTKSSNAGSLTTFNGPITYTVQIENTGSQPATNVGLFDPLPFGATYVPGSTTVQAPTTVTISVRDNFNVAQYSNNDGTLNWATNWVETDSDGGGDTGGDVQVETDTSALALRVSDNDNLTSRGANLSTFPTATLSFLRRRVNLDNANDWVEAQISTTGGAPWAVLERFAGAGTDAAYVAESYDITTSATSATAIRFLSSPDLGGGDIVYFDDVAIESSFRQLQNFVGNAPPFLANGYTLLPGETMTVTYQVVVNQPPPPGLVDLVNVAIGFSETAVPEADTTTDTLAASGGIAFLDNDGDGIYEPGDGETPYAGLKLTLTAAGPNGIFGDGDDVTTYPMIFSAGDGSYNFTGLTPGNYRVQADPTTFPPSSTLTTGANPIPVTLSAGQQFTTGMFGFLVDLCPGDPNKTEPGQCGCGVPDTDTDNDGVADCNDNCDVTSNTNQADCDNDGIGDECEPDADSDGVPDDCDNCVNTPNANQLDSDGDGVGDVCDNCVNTSNTTQADCDNDGVGDECEPDADSDGVPDDCDNCVTTPNANQIDSDGDGVGDACDNCVNTSNTTQADCDNDGVGDECEPDADSDGVPNDCDNCVNTPNTNQLDSDGDGVGDACDNCVNTSNTTQADCDNDGVGDECEPDADSDGVPDDCDNCVNTPNANQLDSDGDGIGDVCDNCVNTSNTTQADCDNDGIGDECEPDADSDGVPDDCDNCVNTPNTNQLDSDGDSVGDACDNCVNTSNTTQADCDNNGVGDACELPGNDCNNNGSPDNCELAGNDCNNNGLLDSCEIAASVTSDWRFTSSPRYERFRAQSATLPNGKILITGGEPDGMSQDSTSTCELFNSVTGMFEDTASMATSRYEHCIVTLPDGRVLVAGGVPDESCVAFTSCETYNSVTGLWSAAASIPTPLSNSGMVVLPNGKVLLCGGGINYCSSITNQSFLFDPLANGGVGSWTATGNMSVSRMGHQAVLLNNGQVLAIGGRTTISTTSGTAVTELYNPLTGTWSVTTGSLLVPRGTYSDCRFTATKLVDGRVLITGGNPGTITQFVLNDAETYNPTTGIWSAAAPMPDKREFHDAILLPSGKVLIAGGSNEFFQPVITSYLYDPVSNSWGSPATMQQSRFLFDLSLLPNGKVLAPHGSLAVQYMGLKTAEIYGLLAGTSALDCNNNGVIDTCELAGNDCNNNGVLDSCELAGNDCNNNGVLDSCDVAALTSLDVNNNGVPDECEPRADLAVVKSGAPNPATVGQPVTYTIVTTNIGPSTAINVSVNDTLPPSVVFNSASPGCVHALGTVTCLLGNMNAGTSISVQIVVTPQTPATLNNSAVTTSTFPTDPVIANNQSNVVVTIVITDCNNNGVDDSTDITTGGTSLDCNTNGIPDECDIATTPSLDCDNSGAIDSCEIAQSPRIDCDNNGVIDSCELAGNDCNNNGQLDSCDIAQDPALDCDNNGVIDTCEIAGNDCNNNGVLDVCEILTTPSLDCNINGLLDECEIVTTPSLDCDHDGLIDSCQPPCVAYCDEDFTTNTFDPALWLPIGTQTDGVAITQYDSDAGAYLANIFPSPNFRSTGVFDNSSACIPYSAVGTDHYVKGKFYVYRGGQVLQNEIPMLRVRVASRFGVNSMLEVQSHVDADPVATALAADIMPSILPTSPSLYRVDFDPVDVPALNNPGDLGKLLRGFEAYSEYAQDTGYLAMTEIVICVYPAASLPPAQATDQVLTTGTMDAGSLAVRNPATDIVIETYDTTGPADISVPRGTYAEGPEGVTLDTTLVPANFLGVAAREFNPGPETSFSEHLRAEPCKIYKVRFHVTSTQQSNLNAHLRLRGRTVRFNWTQKFEMGGAYAAGPLTNQIAQEALPGIGCLNPDKNDTENGGWYTMLMNTPLSEDIRPEFPAGTPLAVRMPLLSAQPGPGVEASSLLDIRFAMDIVDTFDHNFNATLEQGNMTVDRIEVRSYPLISD